MKIKSKWFFKVASFVAMFAMVVLYSFPGGLPEAGAQTGVVTGTVKLPNGSNAPAGLTVILSQDESNVRESNALSATTTAAGGGFTFNNLNQGSVYVHALADASTNYANSTGTAVNVSDGATSNVGNISLQNAQVKGTITYPNGTTPVTDTRVEVHTPAGDVWIIDYTDANGRYTIGGLPNGTYSWEVQIENMTGYNRPTGQTVTITSGGSIQTINASLIAAPKTISGTVKRDDGTAVNQAAVDACPERRDLQCESDHTDATGSYSLSLTGADWTLDVNPDLSDDTADWVYYDFPETIGFANNNSTETVTKNFTVTKADARVTGGVKLSNRSYTINSDIHCMNSEGRGTVRKTNTSGIFNFAIPAGSYQCSVFALDTGNNDIFLERTITVKSGQTKDIGTFQGYAKNSHITGIARLSDGRTVRGVDVVAWQRDGVGKEMSVSGDGGRFDLSVIPGDWIVGIENGHSYYFYDDLKEVEIARANQTISGLEIQVAQNETWLNGSVKDTNGNTITDASGSVYIRDDEGHKFTGDIEGDGSYYLEAPSEIFSGDINNLYGSKVYVGVMLTPNSNYTFKDEVETTLDRNMTVNITLDRDAETITGSLNTVNSMGMTAVPNINFDVRVIATDNNGNLKSAEVASNGTYSLSVANGTWSISYQIVDNNTGYVNPFPEPESVTVGASSTATKNLSLTPTNATITGTLRDSSGNTVPRAAVFASNHKAVAGTDGAIIKITGETNDNGVFRLNVRAGTTYQVGAGIPPESSGANVISPRLKEVTPTANSSVEANLQFRTSDTVVSGTVRRGGQAVNSGYVQARSAQGGFTSTDIGSNGTYSLNLIQGEDWYIRAAEVAGSSLAISSITIITPDASTETLNFDLQMTNFIVPPPEVKIFNAENSQAISLYDGTTLNIPGGALTDSGEITLTVSPTIDLISQEQSKTFPIGYEFEVKDGSDKVIRSFRQPVAISFAYTEQGLRSLGTSEGQIDPSYLDEVNQIMTSTGFAVPNTTANNIMVYTDHFTTFALTSPTMSGRIPSEKSLILTPASAGGPNVRIVDESGEQTGSIMAYEEHIRGEIKALGIDIDGDGTDEVVTGPGEGLGPHIRVFELDKTLIGSFFAYQEEFRLGVNINKADVDGDGDEEIVVSTMPGGGPNIRVYDYNIESSEFELMDWFWAYSENYREGINMATGDIDGDGDEEIMVSPPRNGGPNIRVYEYNEDGEFELVSWTFAYQEEFRGGVNLATGDIDGNGSYEILTAPASVGGPNLRAFQYNTDNSDLELIDWVMAYQPEFRGGVNIATGDMDGNGSDEIITSPVDAGGPNIRVFSYDTDSIELDNWFWAYDENFRGGVNLMAADVEGDGTDEIITATTRGTPNIRVHRGNGDLVDWFWGFTESFTGGVNLSYGSF